MGLRLHGDMRRCLVLFAGVLIGQRLAFGALESAASVNRLAREARTPPGKDLELALLLQPGEPLVRANESRQARPRDARPSGRVCRSFRVECADLRPG
jgi:hypothetical protein